VARRAKPPPLVKRRLDELRPLEGNPRVRKDEAFRALVVSISTPEFGVEDGAPCSLQPVVVNKHPDALDVILGGHRRVEAAALACACGHMHLGTEILYADGVWALDLPGGACVDPACECQGHRPAFAEIWTREAQLDREQMTELAVRLNVSAGEWDWDLLLESGPERLGAWGFSAVELPPQLPEGGGFDLTVEPGPRAPAPVAVVAAPEMVPLGDLRPHPEHFAEHPEDQVEHIAASIRAHGVYQNIVIAQDGTILVGHAVALAAERAGLEAVPALRKDLDPLSPEALQILTGDNTVALLAERDDRQLTEVLRGVANDGTLEGTGMDSERLAALALVTRSSDEVPDLDAAREWAEAGMPEFPDVVVKPRLMLLFESNEARASFVEQLNVSPTGTASNDTLSARYPPSDPRDLSALRFVAGGD